jgi:hexosaminidase
VCFSKDGNNYTEWYPAEFPMFNIPDPMTSLGRVEARARVSEKNVRFLKVKVENYGVLPKWHPNAGEKAWIMVDEIVVN